jgi:hypothetical protein
VDLLAAAPKFVDALAALPVNNKVLDCTAFECLWVDRVHRAEEPKPLHVPVHKRVAADQPQVHIGPEAHRVQLTVPERVWCNLIQTRRCIEIRIAALAEE